MRIDNVAITNSLDAKLYKSDDFKIYYDQAWKLKRSNSATARASGTSITAAPGNNSTGPSNQRWVDPNQKALDELSRTKRSMDDFEVLKTDAYYRTWKHVFNAQAKVQGVAEPLITSLFFFNFRFIRE